VSRDQPEKLSDKIIFPEKIISEAAMKPISANKLFLQEKIISEEETLLSDENKIH